MSISLIPGIDSSGSALDAERTRMNVIANNIANSNTTRDANGEVYRRQQVIFENVLAQATGNKTTGISGSEPQMVKVREVVADERPMKTVFMPGHPHAGPDGMVQMPNVNVAEEMVDMITASRSIEANVQVIMTAKQMIQRTLEIGRR
jgi:flagellar basal-body rod protein FlgC